MGAAARLRGLRIVFDGPPSHESGRFVEVEDETGKSVKAGEWHKRKDGLWELRLAAPCALDARDAVVTAARELCELRGDTTEGDRSTLKRALAALDAGERLKP